MFVPFFLRILHADFFHFHVVFKDGLAVTANGCQILYRICLQKFYDLAHDKYLHENFIFFFYIGIAFPFR